MAKQKQAEIVPFVEKTAALAVRPNAEASMIVQSFADIARDPNVTPEKLNAIIDAQVRVMAITAKQAFDRDFAAMQGKLPTVTRKGKAKIEKDGRLIRETQYARDLDITEAVRPILAKFGFALRFRNKLTDGLLTVTGILAHRDGHFETDEFTTGTDDTPGKNRIQSWGSARQYGKRYTTIALLSIASEDDDDGASTGNQTPERPAQERKAEKKPAPPTRAPVSGDDKVITSGTKERPGQLQRLWVIIRNSGRNEEAIRTWLHTVYGVDSTHDIKRKDYDTICEAIEKKGPLPMPSGKESK